ncbi:hypothetical protein M409DRAFT_27908 [Zasmidium cellare ATCC 36951]|uniref:Uncharacterized protein n=1 Tax=Zasmidium cellare ATCC 36951 TaxID=1080233 RepID=A0A6A6C7H6_ZASCE|nr:uncharacterized protein M409DRAFT_27908 [Zasmidium cellare ATCC 36951]KAF2161852.1 hypothetical protein M409DRAFT_27908 [Zasmidium cellare ATCC 36951]
MTTSNSIDGATVAPRFAPFNIISLDYKQVKGVGIPLSILIPKQLKKGKHPIANGPSPSPSPTISLAPDYRLLPSSNGLDILSDAEDFYTWLFSPNTLTAHLPAGILPDLTSVLVTGESAGGWHALQAGLLHPSRITAIIAHYPMIDLASPHFSQPPPPNHPKQIFSPPQPQADPSLLITYLSTLSGQEIIPNRIPPDGDINVLIMLQQGLYPHYFGTDPRLYPLEVLERVEGFPPMWVLHGEGDSVVPVEGTRRFVEAFEAKARGREAWGPLFVSYKEGAEHGFDLGDDGVGWREEGIRFIERFWPVREEE